MKHRETIDKENIDIRRVLSKKALPWQKKLKNKVMDNQKKIIMFFSFCALLNMYPVYTCISYHVNIRDTAILTLQESDCEGNQVEAHQQCNPTNYLGVME